MPEALITAFEWLIQCGMDAPEIPLATAIWSAGFAIRLFKRLY